MMRNDKPLSALVSELLQDVTNVLRSEAALLKAELREGLSRVEKGLGLILSGALIALAALLVLVEALVVALANVWPPAIAALVVGLALAVVAGLLIWKGRRDVSANNLAPHRSLRQAEEDYQRFKERV